MKDDIKYKLITRMAIIIPIIYMVLISEYHAIGAKIREYSFLQKSIYNIATHFAFAIACIYAGYMHPERIGKIILKWILPMFLITKMIYHFICIFEINLFIGKDNVVWVKIWDGMLISIMIIGVITLIYKGYELVKKRMDKAIVRSFINMLIWVFRFVVERCLFRNSRRKK